MELFYRKIGHGKPLIILHGLLGISDFWMPLATPFKAERMVVIPDLRNHGRSPHSSLFTYEVMAHDILELMDRLEISQTAIVGHSMGAKVVLQLLLLAPKRFTSVLLIDMSHQAYVSTDFKILFHKVETMDGFKGIQNRPDLEQQVQTQFPPHWATLILKNLKWNRVNSEFEWRCNFKQIKSSLPDLSQAIPLQDSSPVEVCCLRASDSKIVTDQAVEELRNGFEKFECISVTGGHWVHLEQPLKVVEVIENMGRR